MMDLKVTGFTRCNAAVTSQFDNLFWPLWENYRLGANAGLFSFLLFCRGRVTGQRGNRQQSGTVARFKVAEYRVTDAALQGDRCLCCDHKQARALSEWLLLQRRGTQRGIQSAQLSRDHVMHNLGRNDEWQTWQGHADSNSLIMEPIHNG